MSVLQGNSGYPVKGYFPFLLQELLCKCIHCESRKKPVQLDSGNFGQALGSPLGSHTEHVTFGVEQLFVSWLKNKFGAVKTHAGTDKQDQSHKSKVMGSNLIGLPL